jgi:hypothetical protein
MNTFLLRQFVLFIQHYWGTEIRENGGSEMRFLWAVGRYKTANCIRN